MEENFRVREPVLVKLSKTAIVRLHKEYERYFLDVATYNRGKSNHNQYPLKLIAECLENNLRNELRKNHNRICKSLRANQPKPQLKDILDILKFEEMLRVEETDREDDGACSDSDEDGDDTSASELKFVKVKQPKFLNNYPSIKT